MKKIISIYILICFLVTGSIGVYPVSAQEFVLPAPGVMVHLSPSFNPPILKGIKIHTDDPFRFDFIMDKGDSRVSNEQLKAESNKLVKYFLASLTIPEKDLWVNLSPYEKDRIIPPSFGLTEMGRDLLAEDYILKQITASLIYPEDKIGKRFWNRIYEEAQKRFKTTDIPVNTFNKVWIVPEKAIVYENTKAGTAYVVESKLKVMLEQDYLALSKNHTHHEGEGINALGSQIVREIVIPELTKEVNENKNFAKLRQIFNSLILATWYKKKIKDSILAQVYEDRNKVTGVSIDDPGEKDKIYQRYLAAFRKGVYNYIKEEIDPMTNQPIPRKYFSGGVTAYNLDEVLQINSAMSSFIENPSEVTYLVMINVAPSGTGDASNGRFHGIYLKNPLASANGRYLFETQRARAQMEALHKFYIGMNSFHEIGGIGITLQGVDNRQQVVVDFVLPRPNKIFLTNQETFTANMRIFFSHLTSGNMVYLNAEPNGLFMRSSALPEGFLIDRSNWRELKNYVERLSNQSLPDDFEQARGMIKLKGALELDPDWDLISSKRSFFMTRVYMKRVEQVRAAYNGKANYWVHYHPNNPSRALSLQGASFEDRHRYLRSVLSLSGDDLESIHAAGLEWSEIRTLGTVADPFGIDYSQEFYHISQLSSIENDVKRNIGNLIGATSEISPESLMALVHALDADFDRLELNGINVNGFLDYVLQDERSYLNARFAPDFIFSLKGLLLHYLLYSTSPATTIRRVTPGLLQMHMSLNSLHLYQQVVDLYLENGIVKRRVDELSALSSFNIFPTDLDADHLVRKVDVYQALIKLATEKNEAQKGNSAMTINQESDLDKYKPFVISLNRGEEKEITIGQSLKLRIKRNFFNYIVSDQSGHVIKLNQRSTDYPLTLQGQPDLMLVVIDQGLVIVSSQDNVLKVKEAGVYHLKRGKSLKFAIKTSRMMYDETIIWSRDKNDLLSLRVRNLRVTVNPNGIFDIGPSRFTVKDNLEEFLIENTGGAPHARMQGDVLEMLSALSRERFGVDLFSVLVCN